MQSVSMLPKPFPRGRCFVQPFPTLRLVFSLRFMFCAFGFDFILLALPFCFAHLFSFSAAAPEMTVLQGSLIPCQITEAQNSHPLSSVFLSMFSRRIFVFQVMIFSTGFSVWHFKCSKSASTFSIPGSGHFFNALFP